MKVTKSQLKKIIREALTEVEFHGETPAGQLYGTEKEDVRFKQQLEVENVMKEAGLDGAEISFVNQILDDQIDSADFYDSSAYKKLFQLLAFDWGEMPYGTAKARTGMPDEWILDYLQGLY